MKSIKYLVSFVVILLALTGIDSCEKIDILIPPTPTLSPQPSIVPMTPVPQITPTPVILPVSTLTDVLPTPSPTQISCIDIKDGPGKRLWKPKSESTGGAVVLLPKQYCGQNINLSKIGSRVVRSHCNGANNGRYHVFFNKPGSWYGEDLFIIVGHKDCFRVSDASKRED